MGYKYPRNIKDITIPLIIHYYLLRAFRTPHKTFSIAEIITSVLPSVPGRWHNAIRVRYKPVHRFNYS